MPRRNHSILTLVNTLLLISVCGLFFKLITSYEVVARYPARSIAIKTEVLLFVFSFIGYSLTLIFIFGPIIEGATFGVPREIVVRTHYFFDGVCFATAAYVLLSLIGFDKHRHAIAKALIVIYVGVGGYILLATDAFVSSLTDHAQSTIRLGGVAGGDFLFVPQLLIGIGMILVTGVIIRRYFVMEKNKLQVLHIYALLAFLVYAVNCFIGLFSGSPFLIAIRGILFFAMVMLLLQRSRLYDLRSVIPITSEYLALRDMRHQFRAYATDEAGYRETLRQLEKVLLDYKIKKISRFGEKQKSALPRVARSMGLSLSTLYDLINRLKTEREQP